MKISFLSPFHPFRGGIAQFSDSLYYELKKENDVRAFTFSRQYPGFLFPGTSQYAHDKDIRKEISAEPLLDSINPFTFKKTAKKIIAAGPDLFLTSYWMPFFAPSLGSVGRRIRKKGIRSIAVMHNVIPHEKRAGDRKLTRYFLKQFGGFVILNESSKDDLLELKPDAKFIVNSHPFYNHYGEKAERNEARGKLGIPADRKVILFFGFIRDYKGLDMLLESMKDLDDSYMLAAAGEIYGSFDRYNRIIEKYSVQDRVSLFTRYIPDPELPLFFSAADVCVLPYRSATQSGIAGIAYHFDLPVITTNVGGLAEVVLDGKTGLIAEASSESITENIRLYFKENLKERFVPEIKALRNMNSWERLSKNILGLYEKIIWEPGSI